jgi:hypothetical protein
MPSAALCEPAGGALAPVAANIEVLCRLDDDYPWNPDDGHGENQQRGDIGETGQFDIHPNAVVRAIALGPKGVSVQNALSGPGVSCA